ncbi:hypothetical protein BGZ47_007601, partial [Haplosporangium gracile]
MSTTTTPNRQARIKIVQQPLHARMCGFGEKDRRPVDPPPIVQLLLDEQHDQHPARRAHRSAIAAALAAASAGGKKGSSTKKKNSRVGQKAKDGKKAGTGGQEEEDADEESHEDDEGDETHKQQEGSDADEAGADRKAIASRNGRSLRGGAAKNMKHEHSTGSTSSYSLGKHGRQSAKSDHSNSDSDNDSHHSDSDNDNDNAGEDNNGDLDEQDPLFVLHVSLWSHDGTEVRNMIATPGQSDPPKLTRILMGSLVVSPILLNDPEGVPGWYFSFPDL